MAIVVDCRHNANADPRLQVVEDLDEAARVAHAFFLDYGGELREGRPFDPDNDDGDEGGFKAYTSFKTHEVDGELLILEFTHWWGDGPVCTVHQEKG